MTDKFLDLEGHKLRHAARAGMALVLVTACFAVGCGLALGYAVLTNGEERAIRELLIVKVVLTGAMLVSMVHAWQRRRAYRVWRRGQRDGAIA